MDSGPKSRRFLDSEGVGCLWKLRPSYLAFCTVFDCHHAESRSGTTILWFFCELAFLVLASLAEAPRARPQKPIRTDRIPRGFDIGGVVICRDWEKISQGSGTVM